MNNLVQLIEYSVFGKRTDSFDMLHFAKVDAALRSARYYQEHMLTAKNLPNDLEHLSFALQHVTIPGLYLEFGVATGRTINHIAKARPDDTIYGFDVFSGLPETWRTGYDAGTFARTAFPEVPSNCKLVPGLFDDTLPMFIQEMKRDVAFIHVDCDLYRGTCTILETCRPYMKSGTVICFDEYFNYPGYEQHEIRAWKEFCDRYGVHYEYLGFVSSHQQVSVRIL
ncbi:class I SAM-dependent methyltransferase [Azohydromonas lata]|uniref:class I SAM-dependent methyltransferase n=1 Tax=Azohydromonas lata TaxID=45677 RepID=UPI00082B1761|nr:class I SAM-dependent methyltransferase [Azohydromonas lata]